MDRIWRVFSNLVTFNRIEFMITNITCSSLLYDIARDDVTNPDDRIL